MKPGLSQFPVPMDCERRDFQYFRHFFERKASEESQLHDAALARVDLGQSLKRRIHRNQVRTLVLAENKSFVKRHAAGTAASFLIAARAGIIHQYSAHHLGRNGKEVGAVLPPDILPVDQAHVGFVEQSGCLKRVLLVFSRHVPSGEAMQFGINERSQLVESRFVAVAPSLQQDCYVMSGNGWHAVENATRGQYLPINSCLRLLAGGLSWPLRHKPILVHNSGTTKSCSLPGELPARHRPHASIR